MSTHLLEVKDLQVNFKIGKGELTAVQHVSFTVDNGKVLGIVGESGCGKSVTATTLMRLHPAGTTRIANGSIDFDGKDIVNATEKEMCDIRGNDMAMIFQDPMTALNPVYRIGDQMAEMIRAHRKMTKKEAYAIALEMLTKVGIPQPDKRIRDYPHQLSGGMRQRVMIAMALSVNAKLLIADEPTTALDVTIQAQILELIAELQKEFGMALILITHDMGVISDMADDVLVMYAGEEVEYGGVEAIFRKPMHPYTNGLLRSIPRMDEDTDVLFTIPGTVPTLAEMPEGCRFCTRCSEKTERCEKDKPPLVKLDDRYVRCWLFAEGGKSDG